MPMPLKDLTGSIRGYLTIIRHVFQKGWECRCVCGAIVIVRGGALREGKYGTKSCGCMRSEGQRQGKMKHGASAYGEKTPEYQTWKRIRSRCYSPKCERYPNYGGRGIRMCQRWLESFEAFLEDMGHRPPDKTSIERLNVDGHYEPGNCVWATDHTQARNRTDNVHLTYKGRTQVLLDWAVELDMCKGVIKRRLQKGWSVEDALSILVEERPWRRTRERDGRTPLGQKRKKAA